MRYKRYEGAPLGQMITAKRAPLLFYLKAGWFGEHPLPQFRPIEIDTGFDCGTGRRLRAFRLMPVQGIDLRGRLEVTGFNMTGPDHAADGKHVQHSAQLLSSRALFSYPNNW